MQKFIVLYMVPAAGLEDWLKIDESVRKEEEEKMKNAWDAWMTEHKEIHTGITAGAGKTKRVTASGVADVKNDVMLFSIIEAESHDAAVAAYVGHPHFGIPGGWIDVMPLNDLSHM